MAGGNNENSINNEQAVYSAVLPPSLTVFLSRAPKLAFLGMKYRLLPGLGKRGKYISDYFQLQFI